MLVFRQSKETEVGMVSPSEFDVGARSWSGARWMPAVGFLGLLLSVVGCKPGGESAQWLLNGLFDPTQTGQFLDSRRNEIRGSLSILEEPVGIQDAEEPSADDLVPEYKEHRFTPGDTLTISIFELMVPGQATVQQFVLGNSGFESIPVLGRVRMAGLTTAELELELKEQIRAAGILPDPEVQVTLQDTRSRRFSVIGSVQRTGSFEIPQPDYRLLSAIADAGGIPPQIDKVYIFRRGADAGMLEIPSSGPATDMVARRTQDQWPAALTMSETSSGPASTSRSASPAASAPANPSSIVDEMKILEGAEAPAAPGPTSATAANPSPTATTTKSSLVPNRTIGVPSGMVDELKILEGAPQPTRQSPMWDPEKGAWVMKTIEPTSRKTTMPSNASAPSEGEPMATDQTLSAPVRIIEIPTKELLAGDPRYNVVIRPYDLINVPPGAVGEYYVMGNIARPGAYELTGRRLTVKEAVASSGGFGPLAWPSRADLVRRVSQDEEQIIQLDLDAIFAGNAPDFYLKPNDIVNVGTTPAAVFLAVLRNAFRFSYGFGFVYDRNFADSDSFQAKEQIKQRRIQEAQLKGLPIP